MERFLFFLLLSSLLFLPTLAKKMTDGFHLSKTRLEFPHHPEWEVPLDPEISSILTQKFYYLAKGAQCYVFESECGQFVLKLFRYDQPPAKEKIIYLFDGCKLAYDRLKEETALLYLHLNPTSINLSPITIKDRVGRSYQIFPDRARFAIQRKGGNFYSSFEAVLANPEEMKRKIDAFVNLLKTRAGRGVLNTDKSLGTNFGFIGERAIEFDFGNFRDVSDLRVEEEVKKYTAQLKEWLKIHSPEWSSYLEGIELLLEVQSRPFTAELAELSINLRQGTCRPLAVGESPAFKAGVLQ
jgi:hypothetical protein